MFQSVLCFRLNIFIDYGNLGFSSFLVECRSRNIGLGNGMKKSKLFEEFVMEKRLYLKETLKLCERAVQKILIYSNNFIHKKLKSEDVSDFIHKKLKSEDVTSYTRNSNLRT